MIKVMVSGKFDPPHEGHIEHILKASKLGDFLIVIVQSDEAIIKERKLNVPLWARLALMKGLLMYYHINGDAFMGLDVDGKSVKSLQHFRPNIYAKGGDRTPDNMPKEEIEVCRLLGIEFRFGIGDQLNASSRMEIKKEG